MLAHSNFPILPTRPWENETYVQKAARRRQFRIAARRARWAGMSALVCKRPHSSKTKKAVAKAPSQKERRRLKNRLSALASRKRKAAELEGLRTENKTLKRENEVLRERLAAALAANEARVGTDEGPRRKKRRKVDQAMSVTSATSSTVSAYTPSSPERPSMRCLDFSSVFDDSAGPNVFSLKKGTVEEEEEEERGEEEEEYGAGCLSSGKSSDKKDDDDDNNNENNDSNDNDKKANDETPRNPILGELGIKPAVFTDETNETPTPTTTTTIARAARARDVDRRLQSLRSRALRVQKKQWKQVQQLPLACIVRALLFSRSLVQLNLNLNLKSNPSLAPAKAATASV